MKRIPFKPEFKEDIKAGRKNCTSRWKISWKVGDVCAAVCPEPGKPAFLVPASEAFCHVRILAIEEMLWRDFTEPYANMCGVTRDWYLKSQGGQVSPLKPIYFIRFEVVS